MESSSSDRDALFIGVLSALALAMSAAPDVGYGDSGEIGTAAVVLGVAHPTGFAFDLLWLKAASLVPLGPLPFRLNVANALAGGAALGLCAALIGRCATRAGVREVYVRRFGVVLGVTGLYGFAAFASATRAVEVYALALSAVVLALLAASRGARGTGALAVIVGLSCGLHVTAGLYAAAALVVTAWRAPRPGRFILTRAPLAFAGTLVLAYLPLASRRDPPLDWGDPETLPRAFAHLTAQRIRDAYQGELFGGNETAPALLRSQLDSLAGLLIIALIAVLVALWQTQRARASSGATHRSDVHGLVLGIAAVGGLDLAYALLINPMGVRDLQCGHVAGACIAVLGGVGGAILLRAVAERPAAKLALQVAFVSLAVMHLAPAALRAEQDEHALAELYGSGGLLTELPPRTVFLCTSDNACAASMFGLVAERVRPDLDSAPAQHLWDATVLRQIEGFDGTAARTDVERHPRALQNRRALLAGSARRPLALESRKLAVEVSEGVRLAPLHSSAFLAPTEEVSPDAFTDSFARLERALHSRFARPKSGPGPSQVRPNDERARFEWSRVYGELGAAAVMSPAFRAGVVALERATEIAPERPTAWINFGVALDMGGQTDAAVRATQRAIELDPTRPGGWVNLVRFESARGNDAAVSQILELAAQAGVDHPELRAPRAARPQGEDPPLNRPSAE